MVDSTNFVEKLIDSTPNLNKAAYIYKTQQITYSDLYQKTAAIAVSLKKWGLVAGDRLLLMMYDTPAFAETFLAALWVGVIPVPLNPKLKKASLQYVVEDSGAKAIVCEIDNGAIIEEALLQVDAQERFNPQETYVIIKQDIYPCGTQTLNTSYSLSTACESNERAEFFSPGKSAHYWQYTSGTTGAPKAVMHRVNGMTENNHQYAQKILKVDEDERIYSTAKMFFGYGLGNSLFFTLMNNATALLDDRWPNDEYILNNIKNFQPTLFCSVPSIYNALDKFGSVFQENCKSKLRLISAGSPLPASTFITWRERYGLEIVDGIGATEVGHIFVSNRPGSAKAGVTGLAVPGYEIRLEGENGCEPDTDEKGVLCVKGPSVALGYYNNFAKTSERFVDGWYRTGDMFTKDKSGSLRYIGREDDLFKVNGRWVEPQSIENFIYASFENVKEVALVPRLDGVEVVEPVVFLAVDESIVDRFEIMDKINTYMQESFQRYMVPKAYYFVDELPKNDNGKIVRKKMIQKASQEKCAGPLIVTTKVELEMQ